MGLRLAGERYPSQAVFETVTITDGAGHYLKLPKLTTSQRDALTPGNGMLIYNSTTNQFERYQNGSWGAFGGLEFVECYSNYHNVSQASTWEDWDLSDIVPQGTKVVYVFLYNVDPEGQAMGTRRNGSVRSRYWTNPTAGVQAVPTECDANRIIEIYYSGSTPLYGVFRILGYWI